MDNINFIKTKLLYSLARKRKWGESHTDYENIFKILRSESLGKEALRQAREYAEELIRAGFIIKKPTGYGMQISLNPRMAQEIKKIIKEQLGFDI